MKRRKATSCGTARRPDRDHPITTHPATHFAHPTRLQIFRRMTCFNISRSGNRCGNSNLRRSSFRGEITFEGDFQAAYLNRHTFTSLAGAAEKMEAGRRDDNEEQLLGAIANEAPAKLIKSGAASSLPEY